MWTWGRAWAALPYAFTMTNASMTACRKKGVRDVFTTLWGDDGMEADIFSALPALQLFAEYGYADAIDMDQVKRNFAGATGAQFDDFVEAAKINYFAFQSDGATSFCNHGKWLLFEDPALALMDPQVAELDLRGYYTALADALDAATGNGLSAHLAYPARFARALSLKVNLRRDRS